MALQLKTISKLILNSTLRLVQNNSRVPSTFYDPYQHHRQFSSENSNHPDAIESPIQKYNKYLESLPKHLEGKIGERDPKEFHILLNVQHFLPYEITVHVLDKSILVRAHHEKHTENGDTSMHFTRCYQIPEGFSMSDAYCYLTVDGMLTVSVPPQHERSIITSHMRRIRIQRIGFRDQFTGTPMCCEMPEFNPECCQSY